MDYTEEIKRQKKILEDLEEAQAAENRKINLENQKQKIIRLVKEYNEECSEFDLPELELISEGEVLEDIEDWNSSGCEWESSQKCW